MKWVLWLGYALLLLVGAISLTARHDEATAPIVAAKALARGDALDTGDIQLPGGALYMTEAARVGSPITAANTAPLLIVNVEKGALPLVLELGDVADRQAISNKRKAWICPTAKAEAAPVGVRSLACRPGSTACVAVVALPVDRSTELKNIDSPKLRAKPCE
jgi:hypothetical protein